MPVRAVTTLSEIEEGKADEDMKGFSC
jgi:hypothetical protein